MIFVGEGIENSRFMYERHRNLKRYIYSFNSELVNESPTVRNYFQDPRGEPRRRMIKSTAKEDFIMSGYYAKKKQFLGPESQEGYVW
jgi:hypothetical protein